MANDFVVEVTRGDAVESVHRVAACAVDRDGEVILAYGDQGTPHFLRSSAKPFIAGAIVAAGAAARFDFEPKELAVMAGSHTGQPFHIEAVRSILKKIGMNEADLQCGVHSPYNAEAAKELERAGIPTSPIYNNCSGKHAGILALCKVLGADPATYLSQTNPAEEYILEFCARASGVERSAMTLAIDGCGIPVYAIPLRNAALSFLHLGLHQGGADARALHQVCEAMAGHPEFVSGTGEFDTRLMQAGGGEMACKSGAEGFHGTALLDRQAGLACKVLDGAARARGPAVLGLLRELGASGNLEALADVERPIVYNRAGRAVGEVRARRTVAVSKARS